MGPGGPKGPSLPYIMIKRFIKKLIILFLIEINKIKLRELNEK